MPAHIALVGLPQEARKE